MKSREVLNDCTAARDFFAKAVENGDYQQAKILWFSCVTLLRTVGHVLHKVDSVNFNVNLQNELKNKFASWKATESIFKEFIDKERNLILKEYDVSVEVKESEGFSNLVLSDGSNLILSDGSQLTVKTMMWFNSIGHF
jgi:hypothetical protein